MRGHRAWRSRRGRNGPHAYDTRWMDWLHSLAFQEKPLPPPEKTAAELSRSVPDIPSNFAGYAEKGEEDLLGQTIAPSSHVRFVGKAETR